MFLPLPEFGDQLAFKQVIFNSLIQLETYK